jgi:hypothetical protein
MRLKTDTHLRKALYGLYLALFEASKACPKDFHRGRLTTILTGMMGLENDGWRVVGITSAALRLLAQTEFDKRKLPRKLCRGHLVDRSRTASVLFERPTPAELREFFEVFLQNDRTVIMLAEENPARHAGEFPEFIPIDNPDAELFPNGSLIGWKHRESDREFLRELHATVQRGAERKPNGSRRRVSGAGSTSRTAR